MHTSSVTTIFHSKSPDYTLLSFIYTLFQSAMKSLSLNHFKFRERLQLLQCLFDLPDIIETDNKEIDDLND